MSSVGATALAGPRDRFQKRFMRKALLKCTLNGIHGKLMPVSERQVVTDGSAESASAVAYGATPHSRNYRQNALYNTAGLMQNMYA